MSDHERNLRDLAAMFAMMGLISGKNKLDIREITETSYAFADELMVVRDEWIAEDEDEVDQGIAAIKPKRKYERKSTN